MDSGVNETECDKGAMPKQTFRFTTVSEPWKMKKRDAPNIINGTYLTGDLLGHGTFATVREVLHIKTLERCAAKIFNIQQIRRLVNGEDMLRMMKCELRIVKRLSHPNIIKVHNIFVDDVQDFPLVYMIMEYCAISVKELIVNSPTKKLPSYQTQRYFIDLIDGLEYLHSNGVVHKDIKPDNMLVSNGGQMKLTDLGVCEVLNLFEDELCSCNYGTIDYQPPELFTTDSLPFSGFKVDVWCAGCTLYQMITGKLPFEFSLIGIHVKTKEIAVAPELQKDVLLNDLIYQMLTKDPNNRLSVEEVKLHEWLKLLFPVNLVTPEPRNASKKDKYRSMTITPALHELHFPLSTTDNTILVPDENYQEYSRRHKTPIVKSNRSPRKGKKKHMTFRRQ